MNVLYPDISHHHPVTDWDKVGKQCKFLITKATEGTTYIDPTLTEVIVECEKRKLPYWVYVYLRKGNEKAQAEYMVDVCKNNVGKYFIGYVLDVEEGNDPEDVLQALKWLEKQGTKCMVYFMYSQFDNYKKVVESMGENTVLWEARYGKNDGTYNPAYPCHGEVSLHQFTDKGKVDGIMGNIDLNRLTGKKTYQWFTNPIAGEVVEVLPNLKGYTGHSIVEGLNKKGYPSSFSVRKKYWAMLKQAGTYTGTAEQNLKMIELLGGKVKEKFYIPSLKGYKGFSVVDGLKKFGYDYSMDARKLYYKRAGLGSNYKGTALQNIKLLNKLKEV